ncbi:ubiquitin-activating enzyme [Cryptosporidium ryanae]|uniref:ubiquitin-activating enzyme n=1 Tax=Cryptosporidium ryanae TaxID=515981 RepID=UPI00351A3310|nr:ubiquitin-activating enzyme [Cryptosporidium ryanae]
MKDCKILLVGVGGLGSEILKCLLFSGFRKIDIVDNDVVEISNLARQIFYRECDVGEPKAIVMAKNIQELFKYDKELKITPFKGEIEDLITNSTININKYEFILSGLDNIQGRRVLNAVLFQNAKLKHETGDEKTQIFIESGTEGLNGHTRVIIPNFTSCYECTLNLNTEEMNFPLCEIKEFPRTSLHCIAYAIFVYEQQIEDEADLSKNGGNVENKMEKLSKIYNIALNHANFFGIKGVTFDLTERVVGSVVPTPLSTNTIVASYVVSKIMNIISSPTNNCCKDVYTSDDFTNYFLYYGESGIYCSSAKLEKEKNCVFCSI